MAQSTGKRRRRRQQQRRSRHTLTSAGTADLLEQFEQLVLEEEVDSLAVIGPRPQPQTPSRTPAPEAPRCPNPVISMRADVMNRMGLAGGDAVLLHPAGADEPLPRVCVVWPASDVLSDSVRVDAVTLRLLTAHGAARARILPVPQPIRCATSIVLAPHTDVPRRRDAIVDTLVSAGLARTIIVAQMLVDVSVYGRLVKFRVVATDGEGAVRVGPSTAVRYEGDTATHHTAHTTSCIGGLERQVSALKSLLDSSLFHPEALRRFRLPPPRGVLLYGPPGCGKTMLAGAVAAESGAHVVVYAPRGLDDSEDGLRGAFAVARSREPAIVIIDEIDAVAPARTDAPTAAEAHRVSTLLSVLDGSFDGPGRVVLFATSSRPDSIDPALRRAGRIDREIELAVPNRDEREDIIGKLLRDTPHELSPDDIAAVSAKCHGFVGADLLSLCTEARTMALRRGGGGVTGDDMAAALTRTRPSAMREVFLDVPRVLWTEIGGHGDVKQKLREAVEWPLKHAEAFERMSIRPPRGILLYGPPGCSKTMMAKALATESGLNFVAVKGPELYSKWLFRRARSVSPSIVFLDEVDALASHRGASGGSSGVHDRVLSQLLMEMDGVESLDGVVVVAATNRPDMLDKALMRPGRFDHILYIGLPDGGARTEIFAGQLRRIPHAADVTAAWLRQRTDGYSGAECVAVCREAALAALNEDSDVQHVSLAHFEAALGAVRPRTSPEMLAFFDEFRRSHAGAEL